MIGLSDHPWMCGLLGDDEIAGIFAPETECKRLLRVEAAWTRALGDIASEDVESIASKVEAFALTPEALKDGFATDGVPIPALVKLLKHDAAPDKAQWIHQGLTSQDVMDTSLILALVDIIAMLSTRVAVLDQRLAALSDRFGSATIMAYTRMQPALEKSVGELIGTWRQPLALIKTDLATAQDDLRHVQWGGPIGARDHPQAKDLGTAFARQLGLNDPGMAWHTDRTRISNAAHVLTRIATATGKIGEDVALMAAIGPDQIVLAGGSSSAMAHKNNPVKAETLIALSDIAASQQSILIRAARHEGSRSGQAWILEWIALPQLCLTTGAGLLQSLGLLETIESIGADRRDNVSS